MFKISSKFGVAFLALALTALVSILAACGGGSVSPNDGDSSSSSYTVYSSIPQQNPDTIQIGQFAVGLNTAQTTLNISGTIEIYQDELEYFYVMLGNDKIINNTTSLEISGYKDFQGEEWCNPSNDSSQVQLWVKLKSRKNVELMATASFKRDYNVCHVPSSSSVSSSSADNRQFSALNSNPITLNATSGTRGVSFDASGISEKTDAGLSHIYFEKVGSTSSIKAGSNVTIISTFSRGGGCDNGDRFYYSTTNLEYGEISNPQTHLSCFGFRESNAEESKQFIPGIFFMVRTNGATGAQWTANDYLVAFTNESATQSGNSIKIVAWKLQ